jgi:hypothetical protein
MFYCNIYQELDRNLVHTLYKLKQNLKKKIDKLNFKISGFINIKKIMYNLYILYPK